MPRDDPGVAEMLRTVRDYVDRMAEQSIGGARYDALVASYLLTVIGHEITAGAGVDARDQRLFQSLLDRCDTAEELQAELCRRIRAGDFDAHWDELLDAVLGHVVDKVKMSRPEHLAPQHGD